MSSGIAERIRCRPWATWLAAAAAVAGLGVAVPEAVSRPVVRPTLRAATNFVVFDQHVALSGTSPTKKVTLLARHFGESEYRPVATADVQHGEFHFSPVPSLATSYKVTAGSHSPTESRPVQVYVHLDQVHFTCDLCKRRVVSPHSQLHYSIVVRVPASDLQFFRSRPVYLYVGTSAGKVQSERRVGTGTLTRSGRRDLRVSGTLPIHLPAGFKLRFTACVRTEEHRTGVGLPSVHDCGSPRLSHEQLSRYVG